MSTTVQKGKWTEVHIISKSHGRISVPLQQNLNIVPAIESESVGEYNNRKAAVTDSEFADVDVSFEYLAGDNKVVEAMVMDLDPNDANGVLFRPDMMQQVTILSNDTNRKTGKIYQGALVQQLSISKFDDTGSVKDNRKYAVSAKGAFAYHMKGKGILYTRLKAAGSTAYATAEDTALTGAGPYTASLAYSALATKLNDGTTQNVLLALLNGNPVELADVQGGVTVTGTNVSMVTNLGATDILELLTPYTPA